MSTNQHVALPEDIVVRAVFVKGKWRLRCWNRENRKGTPRWERLSRTPHLRRASEREAEQIERGLTPPPGKHFFGNRSLTDGLEPWAVVADEYEVTHLRRYPSNFGQWRPVRAAIENLKGLKYVDEIQARQVNQLVEGWLVKGLSTSTVEHYKSALRVFLRWAHPTYYRPGLEPPKIRVKSVPGKARGVTEEQYESMREVIEPEFLWVLEALWYSGLRIGELLKVTWESPGDVWPDFANYGWVVETRAGKLGKWGNFPMAIDFPEWLGSCRPRQGKEKYMFPSREAKDHGLDCYKKAIARAGRRAKAVVGQYENGKTIYASAHDIRRGFGCKWAELLPGGYRELQRLMRHRSIKTTMDYYVHTEDDAVIAAMKKAMPPKTLKN